MAGALHFVSSRKGCTHQATHPIVPLFIAARLALKGVSICCSVNRFVVCQLSRILLFGQWSLSYQRVASVMMWRGAVWVVARCYCVALAISERIVRGPVV